MLRTSLSKRQHGIDDAYESIVCVSRIGYSEDFDYAVIRPVREKSRSGSLFILGPFIALIDFVCALFHFADTSASCLCRQ